MGGRPASVSSSSRRYSESDIPAAAARALSAACTSSGTSRICTLLLTIDSSCTLHVDHASCLHRPRPELRGAGIRRPLVTALVAQSHEAFCAYFSSSGSSAASSLPALLSSVTTIAPSAGVIAHSAGLIVIGIAPEAPFGTAANAPWLIELDQALYFATPGTASTVP